MVCFQPISTRDQGSFPRAPGHMDLQRTSKRPEQGRLDQEPLQGRWQFYVLRKNLSSGDDNNRTDHFWCQSRQPVERPRNPRVGSKAEMTSPCPSWTKAKVRSWWLPSVSKKTLIQSSRKTKEEQALSAAARILLKHRLKAAMSCQGYQSTGLAD